MASNLSNLPPSDDEYWDGADTTKTTMVESPKCKHYFVYTKGIHVECRKCGVGYFLVPGFNLKDGHIYENDTLVI